MAKIQLGKAPKRFKHEVSFPLLDGGKGTIEFNFIYRTMIEYGKFIDDWQEKTKDAGAAAAKRIVDAAKKLEESGGEVASVFGTEQVMASTVESKHSFILDVADGWNLDVAFTPENVLQLANEFPQAVNAAVDAYRGALVEGRLGN